MQNKSPKIISYLSIALFVISPVLSFEFKDKNICPPNKCVSCGLTSNNVRTTLTCNLCYGWERKWKDSTNKIQSGAFCTDTKIALDNCDIAQPTNDISTAEGLTAEDRKSLQYELEGRYALILKFNSPDQEIVKNYAKMLDEFKLGGINLSVVKGANADRVCLKCTDGYFLDNDGKCKEADPISNCQTFSSKSVCTQCAPKYWQVTKSAGVFQCEKADFWYRVEDCYYHAPYTQNR